MEIENSLLTAALTIIGGVSIYIFGDLTSKFWIEPINNLKISIGKVNYGLIYYAHYYCNPGVGPKEKLDETSEELRKLASELSTANFAVNGRVLFVLLRVIPNKKHVEEAVSCLIGLSNSVHNGDTKYNYENKSKIKALLKLGQR